MGRLPAAVGLHLGSSMRSQVLGQVCRDAARPGLQQSRRVGASIPQLCLVLLLHSSLILGCSSSQAPAAKCHLRKRFVDEEDVAEPLGP